MGNTNKYRDVAFMERHIKLQKQFRSEKPLFDIEDIKLPLFTSDMKIVDATGRRVKLAGGNWSGGHMKRHCVGGLDKRPLLQMCHEIRHKFGMNSVRLTFSLQLFRQNNFIDKQHIKSNPDLFGKTAIQIFDATVQALTDVGLMVYLNNHTSKSQWCCSNNDGDGLWWNDEYSEDEFFGCLQKLAVRYKNNPRVIGMDLRNEIRKSKFGTPTWGDGNIKTDWKLAAQTIGNRIQKIAPHWLIIIGGINYQLDLTGVMNHPIRLEIPNKLVYSGHFYGFSWGPILWAMMSEQWFRQKLFNDQLYVRVLGVPFIIGQFGNNTQDDSWKYLIRYVRELDLDWTYWCIDGYKCDKMEEETYGIWDFQFKQQRNPQLMADLKKIGRPSR